MPCDNHFIPINQLPWEDRSHAGHRPLRLETAHSPRILVMPIRMLDPFLRTQYTTSRLERKIRQCHVTVYIEPIEWLSSLVMCERAGIEWELGMCSNQSLW